MKKSKQKENSDSVFTLDELIQESIENNNFLKKKMDTCPIPNTQSLNQFFTRKIKLQNSSQKVFWERNTSQQNVNILYITYIDI